MKIALISSSTRIGRTSDKLVLALQSYIQDNFNAKCVTIDLLELNIPMFSQRYEAMDNPEKLYVSLSNTIESSDGVIIITPEYNGSITSALKNLIDLYGSREFGNKPIAIATVSSGILGGTRAGMQLQQIILSIESCLFPKFLLTGEIRKKIENEGQLIDSAYKQTFETFCKEFIRFVADHQLKKPELKVNSVHFSELEDILKMQIKAFQYEARIYQRNDLPALMQDLESLQKDFSKYDYFKANYKNELAGAVRSKVVNNSCVIERLMVSPTFQKKDIGRTLMEFVENKYQNIDKFELVTGRKSVGNIRFYEQRGYKKVEKVF